MNGRPMRGLGSIVVGVYGLSSVVMICGGTRNTTSFVVKAARFTIPLVSVLSVSTRVGHLLTRLGRGRDFLRKVIGGLDGRGFIGGTPTTMVRLRHGGRTSTRDVVGSLGRDLAVLLGEWSLSAWFCTVRERPTEFKVPFFFELGFGAVFILSFGVASG